MNIAHRATDGFRGNRNPLCGAFPTKWAADAINCEACEKAFVEKSAQPRTPATEAEIDAKMAEAGFEYAGNAGAEMNRLTKFDGRKF